MRSLIALWFGLRRPVSRRAYALTGFGLMAFKYAVEALAIHRLTGHVLMPLDYFNPLLTARVAALGGADWLLAAWIVWTLPFLWIGVSMTLRRAEDAGRSPFIALFYLVPVINYVAMLALCVLPGAPGPLDSSEPRPGTAGFPLRSALLGVAAGAVIALVMLGASVWLFEAYGTTLFVATPFVIGATAAFLFNRTAPQPPGATIGVAVLSIVAAGGAILVLSLEGALCLLMAAAPAVVMGVMGAAIGRELALRRARLRGLAAALLPLPLLAGIEASRPQPPMLEVESTVEVAAAPAEVWPHVVSFPDIAAEPAWPFRLGVARPERATVDGHGAGAQRRCEFTTGAFVEPITAWDEPRHLAFSVIEQPPPMIEWSPYRRVAAPHLQGYLRVREGEFRLEPLSDGRTRLIGRTRYQLDIHPAGYWRLWSDAIIHAIHRRVLDHVKGLAEKG
jgi:uncharacterized membrane protein YhaH (DUF805 family)